MTLASERTQEQLDWPQLCDWLARHCAGRQAEEFWRAPDLEADPARVAALLAQAGEAIDLLRSQDEPPFDAYYDVRKHLARLRRQAALEGPELLEVAGTMGCVRSLKRYLARHDERCPLLAALGEELPELGDLAATLSEAFDGRGELADSASPELGNLRRRVVALHEGLTQRMDRMVLELARDGHLQDTYFTQRQERYVVPVRAGARGYVRGIVHDVSNSGQTLFVEPEELVEQNNRLRIAEMQVLEEERRILERLSGWVRQECGALEGALTTVAHLDRVFAAAQLGLRTEASVPDLCEGELRLLRARHPLLLLQGRAVVANDIELSAPGRVLIVSGPNTGGKTVTLKTVGLFALMLRAGIPLPVAEGSRMPLFGAVHADIGDAQSIQRSLSTFSAHLTNLAEFLPATASDSLVLLDELVVGTDPLEGELLAVAILRWLAERGSWAVVTTHYDGLKTLPLEDARFVNASVGFDPESLAPTFRLSFGLPGRSSPIDIAQHLGLPPAILAAARAARPLGARRVDEALRTLEQTRLDLDREQRALRLARHEAEKEQRRAELARVAWEERRNRVLQDERDTTLAALRDAREQLAAAVRELQGGERPGHAVIHRIRRKVELQHERVASLPGSAQAEADDQAPPDLATLRVGQTLEIPRRGLRGVVEEVDVDKARVALRVGSLRMSVGLEDLRPDSHRPPEPAGGARRPALAEEPRSRRRHSGPKRIPLPAAEDLDAERYTATPGNSCDLRGCRADEGLAALERYMDLALSQARSHIFVVHGHGTGIMKKTVREYLETSPYVERWRPGVRGEGGDGVSLVWLDRG